MTTVYDSIGLGYSSQRCTDPKIAQQLFLELEGAQRILNIGAGTGSYEPQGYDLIAVEPSSEMIKQRASGTYAVKQAKAESLPFESRSFSHAMTVLSMHHWHDSAKAFEEIKRVATEKFVAVTWFPNLGNFWLTDDYFPEILQHDIDIFPSISELERAFGRINLKPLLIPVDCKDGFLAAYWARPNAYLDSRVRRSISSFSKVSDLDTGLGKLKEDLDSGKWHLKNEAILSKEYIDVGYRIVTADLS